jgi:hypothetical protein
MAPGETRQGKVGLAFARALAARQFEQAHQLLSTSLASRYSVEKLRSEYEGMVSYGNGPATVVEVVTVMDDWPARQAGDVGWAYVAIVGDDFSEAVTVTVAEESGKLVIRDVQWGRP